MEFCTWLSYESNVTQGDDGGQPCCRQPHSHQQRGRGHDGQPLEKVFYFQPAGG